MARSGHAFERRILAWSTIIAAVIGVIVGQGQGSAAPAGSNSAMAGVGTEPIPTPAPSTSPSPGHWVAQLASVPYSDGTAARDRQLEQIQASIPQAQWLSSDQYGSLTPGFWVVYVDGPFADGAADPADHGLQCAWTDGETPPAVCRAKQSS